MTYPLTAYIEAAMENARYEKIEDSLVMLGKQDEAIREYRRILAHEPACVPALLQLGQVLEKLGRQAEAEECFRLALSNRSLRLPS